MINGGTQTLLVALSRGVVPADTPLKVVATGRGGDNLGRGGTVCHTRAIYHARNSFGSSTTHRSAERRLVSIAVAYRSAQEGGKVMTDDFIVEQPQESDFDALRGLFVSTLEPHYDGDHDAHLTRLINAHRANGQDANGFNSLAQLGYGCGHF